MDGVAGSSLNPLGMWFVILMSVLLLLLPRKYAIIPIIISTCYMTLGQRMYVAGMHFDIIRILIVIGAIRIMMRERPVRIETNAIDKAVIVYMIVSLIIYAVLYRTWQDFVEKMGYTYSDLGIYFIFRLFVKDYEDTVRVIKQIAIIIVPLAVLMLIEVNTRTNIFYYFGGVPQYSEIRDGRVRCQGAFRHPILAGTFGSTILPYFVGLFKLRDVKSVVAIAGFASASIITFASGSSGPYLTYGFTIVAFMLWRMRYHMSAVRRSIVGLIITLHLLMKDPVWFIYARVSDYIGGTGWHRSYLINQAIVYLREWWLIGTTYTAHWMELRLPVNPNMVDITNQYLVIGVNGGLLCMGLFIAIIVKCFKTVGSIVKEREEWPVEKKMFVWGLGSALLGHVVTFMSVAYFDQMNVVLYLLFAMIAALYKYSGPGMNVVFEERSERAANVWAELSPMKGN